jgi:hypothetical protein
MAHGEFEGKTLEDPELRAMFSRDAMLNSDWYKARLQSQQESDVEAWKGHVEYLHNFLKKESHQGVASQLQIEARLNTAKSRLEQVSQPAYCDELQGSIGRQPIPLKR